MIVQGRRITKELLRILDVTKIKEEHRGRGREEKNILIIEFYLIFNACS